MLATKEQFTNGLVKYIDNEVISRLDSSGKWVVGTISFLVIQNVDQIYQELCNSQYLKFLHIVDENGMIDCTKAFDALYNSASKYGNLSKQIPFIGVLTFSSQDVQKLSRYVEGEL